MNDRPAKLLFDECLGKPAISKLAEIVAMGGGVKPQVSHLFEYAPPGTRDEVWVPGLASDGWTVITADGGHRPNKNRGAKLPLLCHQYSVTHVVLSSFVHNRTTFEKIVTIMSVWYQIVDIASDSSLAGKRYVLEPANLPERGQGKLREQIPKIKPQ